MLYVTIDTEYNRLVAFWLTRGYDGITARSFALRQILDMYL